MGLSSSRYDSLDSTLVSTGKLGLTLSLLTLLSLSDPVLSVDCCELKSAVPADKYDAIMLHFQQIRQR